MLKNPLKTLLDILINRFTKERLETLILQNVSFKHSLSFKLNSIKNHLEI